DIRNGTQLECVNCTACIDACNAVMDKVKRPRGLIRYDSYEGIKKGTRLTLSPRIMGYSAILLILLTALILLFTNRSTLDATVLRTPGILFQELPDGRISNLYNIKVVNKTFEEKPIELQMISPKGEVEIIGGSLTAPPGSLCESSFFIKLDKKRVPFRVTPVIVAVKSKGVIIEKIKSSFLGPVHQKGR
ncbi:MAG TPA: cytochrome c oxidase accessory protein CcoG, partial [Calditrichaeota bacterium]|nr:cytochrome c oxidase accessory protein CcoG [Calditrichota bacterium]